MANPKIRCPVCGEAIKSKEGRLEEHHHKASITMLCYGSHMPVFADDNLGWSVGQVMYMPRNGRFQPFGN